MGVDKTTGHCYCTVREISCRIWKLINEGNRTVIPSYCGGRKEEERNIMDIIQVITQELNVERWQVEAAVKLIDEEIQFPLFRDTEKK